MGRNAGGGGRSSGGGTGGLSISGRTVNVGDTLRLQTSRGSDQNAVARIVEIDAPNRRVRVESTRNNRRLSSDSGWVTAGRGLFATPRGELYVVGNRVRN